MDFFLFTKECPLEIHRTGDRFVYLSTLGLSMGKPIARGGRAGISFSVLSGAEVTKPSTMKVSSDLNPQKQEIQNAGKEPERAPGMGLALTPPI